MSFYENLHSMSSESPVFHGSAFAIMVSNGNIYFSLVFSSCGRSRGLITNAELQGSDGEEKIKLNVSENR